MNEYVVDYGHPAFNCNFYRSCNKEGQKWHWRDFNLEPEEPEEMPQISLFNALMFL